MRPGMSSDEKMGSIFFIRDGKSVDRNGAAPNFFLRNHSFTLFFLDICQSYDFFEVEQKNYRLATDPNLS